MVKHGLSSLSVSKIFKVQAFDKLTKEQSLPIYNILFVDNKKVSHKMYSCKLWNIMSNKEVLDCLLKVIQTW
jgi:hypothetical protein